MPQAKFTLSQEQIKFINDHEEWGFADKSAVVRQAVDQLRIKLAKQRLTESARLYAEVYSEDADLRQLTDEALEDWPQ